MVFADLSGSCLQWLNPHLVIVGAKSGGFVSKKIKTRSCVHVSAQVGSLIEPTRSMNQMDPVAFFRAIIKETALGAPK